jgi:hypothetical protein
MQPKANIYIGATNLKSIMVTFLAIAMIAVTTTDLNGKTSVLK